MKWISRGLLLAGLLVVLFGNLLPVNDRVENGQRIGQDCDGPENVLIVLIIGLVLKVTGFIVSTIQIGFQASLRDRILLVVLFLTAVGFGFKLPEVGNEIEYNKSSESSCQLIGVSPSIAGRFRALTSSRLTSRTRTQSGSKNNCESLFSGVFSR